MDGGLQRFPKGFVAFPADGYRIREPLFEWNIGL